MTEPSSQSGGNVALVSDVRIHAEDVAARLRRVPQILSLTRIRAEDCTLSQLERHAYDAFIIDASSVSPILLHFPATITAGRLDSLRPTLVVYGVAEGDDERILGYAALGTIGFVSAEAEIDELVETVLAALRGEVRCPRRVAATVLRYLASSHKPTRADVLGSLSPRQREAIILRLAGESNKQVAVRMGVELGTVKREVHDAFRRLNVRSIREAAAVIGV